MVLAFLIWVGLIILNFPSFEEGQFGLSLSNRFFSGVIDDSIKNVESAELLGIRSHQYKNHAQLMAFLVDAQSVFS
jgi:hypothetical protein